MQDRKFKIESFMKASELIKFMNIRRLSKDDIISIIPNDEFFYLIYID